MYIKQCRIEFDVNHVHNFMYIYNTFIYIKNEMNDDCNMSCMILITTQV